LAANISRGSGTRLAEINVTPLVDVMLVLLIIFMVTAPMLEQSRSQVNVDLPAVAAAPSTASEDAVVITVDINQDLFVNDRPVLMSDLGVKLAALFKSRARKEIFLRADRAVPYGIVVRTMAIIRKAGITRLNMVTDALDRRDGKSSRRRRGR
jgi:biopolymer transport protein TolR